MTWRDKWDGRRTGLTAHIAESLRLVTQLALAGAYRPPLDGLGATLDEVILH